MSVFPAESLYPGVLLFPWDPNPPFIEGGSLKVRIRIAFGASIAADPATWTWTDVTAWWHTPDEVTIGWGRSSGAEQAETRTMSLTVKNTDGRFTAYDPRSPYWPHVRKWTPISYEIDLGDGAGWLERFSGFIRKWPLTWPGASPFMALAKIDAVGLLGRLGRGKPPARSALRRTIAATGPVAYYPAEDGVTAAVAGSAVAGENPLVVSGSVEFKAVEDYQYNTTTIRYGTSALGDLAAGGSLSVTLGSAAAAATRTAWTVHVVGDFDVAFSAGDIVLMEWTTPGGTYVRWQLVESPSTLHTQVIAYTAAGTPTVAVDRPGTLGGMRTWVVSANQVGGTIEVTYRIDAEESLTGTVAGTLAGVASMKINPTGTTSSQPMPFGHLAVWASPSVPYRTDPVIDEHGGVVQAAIRSYDGEPATVRLARLVAEDGLTLDMPAVGADAVTRMGWQAPGTSLELYQQCEAADSGLLYESGFGLGYLPRDARYNPPVALTIDANLGQLGMPFEPVDDDQMLRNLWTVERIDGSSAVAADEESIDLQGEIEGSARLSLASDGPLPDHAGWRLRQSTVQEPRYPAVSLNLAANRSLAAAWCASKPGSRVQVLNPPAQNVPGAVDQLVVGATETYRGRRHWRVTMNVVPASPWMVATVGGSQRVAADGSTLAAAIGAADTSLLLASTPENGAWTEDPADFPVDVRVGGERVTVSAIGPALLATFTAPASGGWGAPEAGPTWVCTPPAQFAAASGEGLIGVNATGAVFAAQIPGIGPDLDVTVLLRADAVAAGGFYDQRVRYRVSGGGYVESVVRYQASGQIDLIMQTHAAVLSGVGAAALYGTGTPFALRVQAHGPMIRHKLWPTSGPQPDAWTATVPAAPVAGAPGDAFALIGYRDTANTQTGLAVAFNEVTIRNPQRLTVSARGLSGFTRAWPAGTPVDVWEPAIVAL